MTPAFADTLDDVIRCGTLRLLVDEGMTMVCTTHETGFACDVSDRVAYFHQGMMEEIGPPTQIFGDAKSQLPENSRQMCDDV